jgi:hypothetical protein
MLFGALLGAVSLSGCGATNPGNGCIEGGTFLASPTSGTANHALAPPGDQVQFMVTSAPYIVSGKDCALPQIVARVYAAWTSSDPTDVTVSSAGDSTNGLATCVNATPTPVTLTATGTSPFSGFGPLQLQTVSLTCK